MNIHFYNWILLTGIGISILIIIFILFPNSSYLGVLIVLLGALLVYLVGESIYKSHIEKNRETFLQKIKPIIRGNIELAQLNVHIIKDKTAGSKLKLLKDIWEKDNPARLGLKEDITRDLLVLKESSEEINEKILHINNLKVKFNKLKDSAEFKDLMGRIISFEDDLEVKLAEFIENSEKISIRLDEIILAE